MSLDVGQFRELVVRSTLVAMQMHSPAAEDLLIGTALVESRLRYLRQIGGGPALGVYQMEPATAIDLVGRYFARRADLGERFTAAVYVIASHTIDWQAVTAAQVGAKLTTDLRFATALARMRYWLVTEPLPAHGDVAGYAAYWKAHYNTALGAGTPEKFIEVWNANIDEGG